jgi:hypothetical protein
VLAFEEEKLFGTSFCGIYAAVCVAMLLSDLELFKDILNINGIFLFNFVSTTLQTSFVPTCFCLLLFIYMNVQIVDLTLNLRNLAEQ